MVLTDISSLLSGFAEPDDTQSLVRMLLYANELDIEGLIATYTEHAEGVRPEYIRHVIRQYGRVRDKLALHDARYPEEEALLRVVKRGNPCDGVQFVGAEHDTEGSDWLIACAERQDDRPLWISVWGGTTDLAQALWRMRETKSKSQLRDMIAKLRVFSIGDQYGIGSWIRDEFPELFYVTSYKTFRGMYKGGNESSCSAQWLSQHVAGGHGALGAAYPIYDGGDPWGRVYGVKEGDSPAFLHLLCPGLNADGRPEYGGWGGRYTLDPALSSSTNHWFDAADTIGDETSERATVYRWREAYQNALIARMDRCALPPGQVNVEPIAIIASESERWVRSGESIILDASASYDPLKSPLTWDWSVYPEAGTCSSGWRLEQSNEPIALFQAPNTTSSVSVHIVLTVTNQGTPPLNQYKRIIMHISP